MSQAIIVDFTNVKEGSGFNKKRVPEGDYAAKIVKADLGEVKSGDNAGTPQFTFTIQLDDKRYGSGKYPYRCAVAENQLWKLRNLLVAAGIQVPKSKTKVDPSKVVGRTIGVTMEDDEYQGKEQSEVAAIFPASELADSVGPEESPDDEGDEDEATEDEAPEATDDTDDEGDEGDEGDPVDEMDRDALKAAIREEDATAKFKRSESDDDLRSRLRALKAPKPAAADEDLEELEIDDEV